MTRNTVKGYIVDTGEGLIAFVRYPYTKAHWVLTHPAVLLKKCPACRVPKGMLCINHETGCHTVETHTERRKFKGNDWKRAIKTVPGIAVIEALREELSQ